GDGFWSTGGVAPLKRDVNQSGDGAAAGKPGKPASAKHGGLQCELRGQAGAHLLFRPRRAGLVIENDIAAVTATLDAVGHAAQLECALPQRDVDLAVRLGRKRDDAGAPFELPFREPLGDALKARPPEGARFRKVLQRGKVRCAERDQLTCWIRRQGSRKLCRELADAGVNDV